MTRTQQAASGLAALWIAVLAYLGLTASRGVIGLPSSLAEPTQHFVSFAVLAALLAIAFPKRWWHVGLTLAVLGIVGEFLQLTTDDRNFDLFDIGMNLVGIIAGLGLAIFAKNANRVILGATVALLVAGPIVLPVQRAPTTTFPSECVTEPPPIGGTPVMLFNGLSDSDASAIDNTSVADIKAAVAQTAEFAVEAWFETPDLQQTGPARVFTISEGTGQDEMNVHLGVKGSTLSVRFRTSCELFNWVQVEDVIKVDQQQHVVVNWSGGVLETWVDGAVVDRTELPWGDLASWDSDFAMLVGDEHGGGRAFDGHVASVTMWDRGLDAQTIAGRVAPAP